MNIIKIKRRKGIDEEFEVRDLREKFYQVDDAYLNGWAKKCGIYATGVYNVLCRHVARDQSCFPSIALMADKLHISPRQVKRAIKVLEIYNIVIVERVRGGKSKYWLTNKSQWTDKMHLTWCGAGSSRMPTKREMRIFREKNE